MHSYAFRILKIIIFNRSNYFLNFLLTFKYLIHIIFFIYSSLVRIVIFKHFKYFIYKNLNATSDIILINMKYNTDNQ